MQQCVIYYSLTCSVVFICPGVTSYQGYNLGFRIYTIDGDYNGTSYALLDHQSWYMDIAEANKNNATKWQYGYSAKVCYWLLPYTKIVQYKEIKNPYLTYY